MPELPEVETIVRELAVSLVGKAVSGIDCINKSSCVLKASLRDVGSRGAWGAKITGVCRRGKFIIIQLEKSLRLVVHLRMTGRLMWQVEKNREKYLRAVINFSDGTKLYFSDVRKFGKLWLCGEKDYEKITGICRLGAEPLKTGFGEFLEIFFGVKGKGKKRGFLKDLLLRQDRLAGIGNIYADEICFRSGLHPKSRIENISRSKREILYANIKKCLEEGILHCGVSVSDFVGTKGDLGRHQNYLKIYGRAGDPCYRCGEMVEKTRVAGRGTSFCGKCQVKV